MCAVEAEPRFYAENAVSASKLLRNFYCFSAQFQCMNVFDVIVIPRAGPSDGLFPIEALHEKGKRWKVVCPF